MAVLALDLPLALRARRTHLAENPSIPLLPSASDSLPTPSCGTVCREISQSSICKDAAVWTSPPLRSRGHLSFQRALILVSAHILPVIVPATVPVFIITWVVAR